MLRHNKKSGMIFQAPEYTPFDDGEEDKLNAQRNRSTVVGTVVVSFCSAREYMVDDYEEDDDDDYDDQFNEDSDEDSTMEIEQDRVKEAAEDVKAELHNIKHEDLVVERARGIVKEEDALQSNTVNDSKTTPAAVEKESVLEQTKGFVKEEAAQEGNVVNDSKSSPAAVKKASIGNVTRSVAITTAFDTKKFYNRPNICIGAAPAAPAPAEEVATFTPASRAKKHISGQQKTPWPNHANHEALLKQGAARVTPRVIAPVIAKTANVQLCNRRLLCKPIKLWLQTEIVVDVLSRQRREADAAKAAKAAAQQATAAWLDCAEDSEPEILDPALFANAAAAPKEEIDLTAVDTGPRDVAGECKSCGIVCGIVSLAD